jgi:hypothetical protein
LRDRALGARARCAGASSSYSALMNKTPGRLTAVETSNHRVFTNANAPSSHAVGLTRRARRYAEGP